MPFDEDEAYGQRATVRKQAVDMYKYKNPYTHGELQAFRQGIEQHANSKMDQSLPQSVNMSYVKKQHSSKINRAPATRLQPQQATQSFLDINQQQQQQQIEVLKNAWDVPIPQFQNNQFQMLLQKPQIRQFQTNSTNMMPAYNSIMMQLKQKRLFKNNVYKMQEEILRWKGEKIIDNEKMRNGQMIIRNSLQKIDQEMIIL